MRVGVIALLHESNTFIAQPTTLAKFQEDILLTGEAVRRRMAATHHEVAGFFSGLAQNDIEAVPIFAARALPFGTIEADAFATLLEKLFSALEAAGKLDGYLVAPHGATVSESHRDADGHWLTMLRDRVGPDVPIVGTLDPHANLSPRMVAATDALIAYRTNPHLDQLRCGELAATILAQTLRGEVKPRQAASFPPIAINIEAQHTSEYPCLPLYELADEILDRPGVITNSVFLGFPFADVEEMGSAFLVVTDDDPELAQSAADELAHHLWRHRQDFLGDLLGIDAALDLAATLDAPVCLLDMGDNVGGGSPGDSTHLVHALHRRQLDQGSFVCLFDPAAVSKAAAATPGEELSLTVGATTDSLHGGPFTAQFRLRGVYEGKFHESKPRHGGFTHYDQGKTVVVESTQGMTIMLTSRRMVPFSLEQLRSCELDPAVFRFLVAKGVNAPVAAYREVCEQLLRVDTPGVTTADVTRFVYHNRRQPMLPFEPDTVWQSPK